MAFLLFLVFVSLNFLRPFELFPQLAGLPIMSGSSAAAGLCAAWLLVTGRGPTWRIPQLYLVAFFTAWTVLSGVLASRWLGSAAGVLDRLAPSLVIFALFYLNLGSFQKVRATATVLCLVALVIAGQSVYSYHTGWRSQAFLLRERTDMPDAEVPFEADQEGGGEERAAPPERTLPDDEGTADETQPQVAYLIRIRHLGFLHDPNDLAQALASVFPLLVALRRPGRRLRNTLLVWAPVGGLLYAVALTHSRGAIIALGGLAFMALRPRLGRTLSLATGVLGGLAAIGLGFTGGRSLSVDESASGRLDAWRAGLLMLKSSPVWGIGYGGFTEYNALVAHNSFVHCFAETGLFGYFFWLAALVLTLIGLQRVRALAPEGEAGEEARRWAHAAQLALSTFLVGAFFLSRAYGVMLFLLLGLGAAVIDIARRNEWGETEPPLTSWVPAVGALCLASVLGFWALLRVLH